MAVSLAMGRSTLGLSCLCRLALLLPLNVRLRCCRYNWQAEEDELPPDPIPAPLVHPFTSGYDHVAMEQNEYCVASPTPVVWPGRGDLSSDSEPESGSEQWTEGSASEASGAEEEEADACAALQPGPTGDVPAGDEQVPVEQLLADTRAAAGAAVADGGEPDKAKASALDDERTNWTEAMSLEQLLNDAKEAVAPTAANDGGAHRPSDTDGHSSAASSQPSATAVEPADEAFEARDEVLELHSQTEARAVSPVFVASERAPARRRSSGRKLPPVPPTAVGDDAVTPGRTRTIRSTRTPRSMLKYARKRLKETGRALAGRAGSEDITVPVVPSANAVDTSVVPVKPKRGQAPQPAVAPAALPQEDSSVSVQPAPAQQSAKPADAGADGAEPEAKFPSVAVPTPKQTARRQRRMVAERAAKANGPKPVAVSGSPGAAGTAKKRDACAVCGKTVYVMERLIADKLLYHKSCFRCAECNRTVALGSFAALDGKVRSHCPPSGVLQPPLCALFCGPLRLAVRSFAPVPTDVAHRIASRPDFLQAALQAALQAERKLQRGLWQRAAQKQVGPPDRRPASAEAKGQQRSGKAHDQRPDPDPGPGTR